MTSEVLVRWADTSDWPSEATTGLLGAAEPATRDRVTRLHRTDDRITVLAAHLLARSTPGDSATTARVRVCEIETGIRLPPATSDGRPWSVPPQCGQSCRRLTSAGGKRIPVSISHTRTLAVVALSPGGEIGVDVETADGGVPLSGELFTAAEQTAARADPTGRTGRDLWAAKEALGKLDGRGILAPLTEIEILDGTTRRLTASAPSGWITHVDLPRDASVALAYDEPVAARVDLVDYDALVQLIHR